MNLNRQRHFLPYFDPLFVQKFNFQNPKGIFLIKPEKECVFPNWLHRLASGRKNILLDFWKLHI